MKLTQFFPKNELGHMLLYICQKCSLTTHRSHTLVSACFQWSWIGLYILYSAGWRGVGGSVVVEWRYLDKYCTYSATDCVIRPSHLLQSLRALRSIVYSSTICIFYYTQLFQVDLRPEYFGTTGIFPFSGIAKIVVFGIRTPF